MPVILALRRLRQEDCEFQARLGYIARLCLKTTTVVKKKKNLSWQILQKSSVETDLNCEMDTLPAPTEDINSEISL
jgi:hypothetical protein